MTLGLLCTTTSFMAFQRMKCVTRDTRSRNSIGGDSTGWMLLASATRRQICRSISIMATTHSKRKSLSQRSEPGSPSQRLPPAPVADHSVALIGRDDSPLTELESDGPPQPKKRSRRKRSSPVLDLTEPLSSDVPKKTRARKTKEPIVYNIQPVETKETTYKGRLGYVSMSDMYAYMFDTIGQACLNTILRSSKPDPIFCSRCVVRCPPQWMFAWHDECQARSA